jgi:hypothetical protein
MGDDRTIRSGLRRRASCAGAAFYFRCLPRRGHGTRAQWMGGSVPHSRGHFSSFVSLNRWCTFFLGLSPLGAGISVRSERRQRRRGRTAAYRVVYACVDERNPVPSRFRAGTRCLRAPDVLEMSPLGGCRVDRRWGRIDSTYLTSDIACTACHEGSIKDRSRYAEVNTDGEQILHHGRQRTTAKGRVDTQPMQNPRERQGNQIGRRTGSENSQSNC